MLLPGVPLSQERLELRVCFSCTKREEKLWDGTGICILKLDFDLDRGRILIYSTHGVQDLHIQVIQLLSFLICQNVSLTFYAQTHLTIQILVSIL